MNEKKKVIIILCCIVALLHTGAVFFAGFSYGSRGKSDISEYGSNGSELFRRDESLVTRANETLERVGGELSSNKQRIRELYDSLSGADERTSKFIREYVEQAEIRDLYLEDLYNNYQYLLDFYVNNSITN